MEVGCGIDQASYGLPSEQQSKSHRLSAKVNDAFLRKKSCYSSTSGSSVPESKKRCTIFVDEVRGKGAQLKGVNLVNLFIVDISVTRLCAQNTLTKTEFIMQCDVTMMLRNKNNKLFWLTFVT